MSLRSRQFLVFVAVGGVCALVDVGLLQLLVHAGTGPVLATTVGFLAGLVLNFILHLKVTFAAPWSVRAAWRYAAVVLLNYGITLGFVACSVALLGEPVPGKLVSLPVIAGNGFLLSKSWVFKTWKSDQSSPTPNP